MPTSGIKNALYRLALPVLSPAVVRKPVSCREGHALSHEAHLVRIIRRNHITGGSFLFQSGDQAACLFSVPFHQAQIPDFHTFYRVASITKMATALTAVILMDKGLIDPEAPVSELVPDGRRLTQLKGIKITHLLSHTSGLSDPPDLERKLTDNVPLPDILSGCNRFSPGAVFHYSNLGFGLLGTVFENILHLSVEDVFRKYLFIPLGLDATLDGSTLEPESIMPLIRILPYRSGSELTVTALGRQSMQGPDPLVHIGYTAGSMYITLLSLCSLLRCIRDGGAPLVSTRYSSFMTKERAAYGKISPSLSYGCGLLIIRDPHISDSPVFGHQGFAYGCVDGAFWEEDTGNIMISLNGGCSEARVGRLGCANRDLCRYAFREELPLWK